MKPRGGTRHVRLDTESTARKEARIARPWGDDQIMVFSWDPPAAHRFRRHDGQFVERHTLRRVFEDVVIDSAEVWLSGADYANRSAIARMKLGDDEAVPVVGLPEEYQAGHPLGGIFPDMPFAKWADTLLVGFMPLPHLIVSRLPGRTDTAGGWIAPGHRIRGRSAAGPGSGGPRGRRRDRRSTDPG